MMRLLWAPHISFTILRKKEIRKELTIFQVCQLKRNEKREREREREKKSAKSNIHKK